MILSSLGLVIHKVTMSLSQYLISHQGIVCFFHFWNQDEERAPCIKHLHVVRSRISIRSVLFFGSSLFCVSFHLSLMSFQSARSCVQRASTAEPRLSGPAVPGPGHNGLAAAQPNPLEQPQGEEGDLLDGKSGSGVCLLGDSRLKFPQTLFSLQSSLLSPFLIWPHDSSPLILTRCRWAFFSRGELAMMVDS